jgi:N-acetylglucosaminyldiphosphoundecaprenol N-acetyl-beta-D-mannosaminyltransferase
MHSNQRNKQSIENDFNRTVVSLLGIPIDLASFVDIVDRVNFACKENRRTIISTPNLNFFLLAKKDKAFYNSLIQSDLVIADGMPLVWISKVLKMSGVQKNSGSNLFEHLSQQQPSTKIKVFLFGGAPGIAEAAHHSLNSSTKVTGLMSTGYLNPGIGSAEELSSKEILSQINATSMDFLVVSLGAKKGQSWIMRNLQELNAPVISHLGAVLAFTAEKITRAPILLQRLGLEWIWRIKEEPFLFRRYWHDGIEFCGLVFTKIIPYAFFLAHRKKSLRSTNVHLSFEIINDQNKDNILVKINGHLTAATLAQQRAAYCQLAMSFTVRLDMSGVDEIDEFGIGQILILLKYVNNNLSIVDGPDYLRTKFRYESLEFLFSPELIN